jgi:ribonuclease VapC
MIAVDTSALVAIAFAEPEREAFMQAIKTAGKALVSTVSVVETRMVIHGRRGQRAVILMDDLLRLPMFELVAPSAPEMDAAYAAFVAYGKGSGHPAGLNFGNVFSYALAKVRGLPLLYKGNDFAQTDIASALAL